MSNYLVLLKNGESILLSDVYGVEMNEQYIKFLGFHNEIIGYFDRNAVDGFHECE